ncbi:HAD family hydrolase [Mammaliicoccus sp. Dog046]|uniref:HAD family hydrolase n=1 Tax=Mammaliicoccus sp. Dog046 TaxID=3034233 RepID=UPI002B25CFDB|nr:HAD family hydrolase [Mammaliicoccus sp. Dog046]WQK85863.1 HAD family hydrolase [Mammaliicoccus sp. Dog046]
MTTQAIFLDMDGTILNENNRVSDYTNEIIQEVRESGVKVFIATGRAYDEISTLVPESFEVDGILSSNGAVGYIQGKEIFKHQLPMHTVYKLIDLAEQHQIYYELFPYYKNRIALKRDKDLLISEISSDDRGDVEDNEWQSRQESLREKMNWVDEIPEDAYSKFYFFKRNKSEIKKWEAVVKPLVEEMNISTSHSTECNLEVMPEGVNKATAIEATLKYLDIQEDVKTYAIGDSDNDRQMLEHVDHPIVMKNAADHIKALGKEVTSKTNVENGVAEYLKERFLVHSNI